MEKEIAIETLGYGYLYNYNPYTQKYACIDRDSVDFYFNELPVSKFNTVATEGNITYSENSFEEAALFMIQKKNSMHHLPNDEIERLAWLLEESGEVVQAIGKIQRFGWHQPKPSNAEVTGLSMLTQEVGDLIAIINIMVERGDLKKEELEQAAARKREKLKNYTKYNEIS